MEKEAITFDFEALKAKKRATLLLELEGLLRDFNNAVYTSQIRSNQINEELSTVRDRTKAVVRSVSTIDEIVLSDLRITENALMKSSIDKQKEIQEKARDLMKDRQKSFDARIAELSIPVCENLSTGIYMCDVIEKRLPKKQSKMRSIQEIYRNLSVEFKDGCDKSVLNENKISSNREFLDRSRLNDEIGHYKKLLSKLDHTRYETLTSIDELMKEDMRRVLSDEKAKALASARTLRDKLHSMDSHNELRLRRLSSQAADCRSKLGETMLILSKAIALERFQRSDIHLGIAIHSKDSNTKCYKFSLMLLQLIKPD
jgi:hypothetical protein